jgi:hypothetical protein
MRQFVLGQMMAQAGKGTAAMEDIIKRVQKRNHSNSWFGGRSEQKADAEAETPVADTAASDVPHGAVLAEPMQQKKSGVAGAGGGSSAGAGAAAAKRDDGGWWPFAW